MLALVLTWRLNRYRSRGVIAYQRAVWDARMRKLFADNLARTKSLLAFRPCFDVLHVKYHAVIEDGPKHADELNSFLGGRLDTDAMAAVVNPELYRNRR